MDANSEYLRVGDYINLGNVKFDGFLAADGILNFDLVTRDVPSMYDDSIFCIHLQRQYAACTELNEFLEVNDTTAMDPDDKHSTKYLNALKRGRENENILNESYMKQKFGQPVLFGDIIQLFHVKSGKYVTVVPSTLATDERENLKVMLDVDGSPYSWICVSPRYKIDREGDRILSSTEVYLRVAERGNEFIHCASHEPNEGKYREVNCSLETSSWRVSIFTGANVLNDSRLLRLSQLVILSDPESKSCLSLAFPEIRSLDGKVDVQKGNNSIELELMESQHAVAPSHTTGDDQEVEDEEPSPFQQVVIQPMGDVVDSNAIWSIEHRNLMTGGAIFWKLDTFRLKHLNTGLYLTQIKAFDEAGSVSSNQLSREPSIADIGSEDGSSHSHKCTFSTTDNRADEGTLFKIHELLNTQRELVNRKAVQIMKDGIMLQRGEIEDDSIFYTTTGTTDKVDAVSLIISKFVQREVTDDPEGEEEESAEDEEGEAKDGKTKMAGGGDESGEARYYESGHMEPLDVYVGVTSIKYLEGYINSIVLPENDSVSTIWPHADRNEVEFFFRMMRKLNYFCRGFPISAETIQLDVDKADPIVRTRRQHQLREQRVLELVLRIINLLIPISIQAVTIANLMKFNKPVSDERLMCSRMGQRVLGLCFEFVYSAVLEHPENQMYVADFMPVLLAHLSSQPLAGKCVTEMLSSNMELQETKIGSREIAIFVNQLKESRMNAMYLGLLQSCCSCQGEGVNNNQIKIANMLFSSSSDAIIQLHADYQKLAPPFWSAESTSMYTPAEPIPGCPVSGDGLVRRGLPALSLTWTTSSIDYSPLGLFGKLSVPIEELYKPKGMGVSAGGEKVGGGKNSKMLAKRSASMEQKKAVADYFIAEMYLGAELAVDGNYVAMLKLDPLFPYEILVTMLLLKVDDSLKAAACRLLLCLHIERDPQSNSVVPRLARTWTDVAGTEDPDLPFVEPGRRNKFGIIQRIIAEHVQGMQNSKWTTLSKPMLHIFRMLVNFNFYGNKERMEDVIFPLLKAIDRRKIDMVASTAKPGEDNAEQYVDLGPTWQETLLVFLGSLPVLIFILALVGVAVGLTIYETAQPTLVEKNVAVQTTQLVILGVFIIEAALRYYCTVVVYLSWTIFFKSVLNWIDIVVILIDVAFLMIPSGGSAGSYTKVLRLLRMIRLARILRAARVVTGIVEDINAEQSLNSYSLPSRYLKAPMHELESMVEALNILALVQQNIDDRNLSLLLRQFYLWYEGDKSKTPSEVFEEVMAQSEELSLRTPDSDDILIDIIMYIHPPLTQACLEVVMGQHSTRKTLLENAANTQLLVSAKRERQLRLIDQMLRQLDRNVETQELWGELESESDYAVNKQTKDILTELIDACRIRSKKLQFEVLFEPDTEIQNLLRNLGLFDICMKYMKLLESVEEDENGELGEVGINTTSLSRHANNLIYWFCLDNPDNQALAFEEIDAWIDTLDAGINSHIVLTAIFRNNEKLMRMCPRSHMEGMVERICKDGKKYEFLYLLHSLTNVGEKNLSENQYEIVKLITQVGRFDKVQSFFCGVSSPEYQEKIDMMAPFLGVKNLDVELLPPELIYYLNFLHVLSSCTIGRINVTAVEAKTQALFQLDDLLLALLDDRNILLAQKYMCQFYYDVIIDVEMVVPGLERNVNVWKHIMSFVPVFENTVQDVVLLNKHGLESNLVDKTLISYAAICALIVSGFFARYYDGPNFRAYLQSQDGAKMSFLQVDQLVLSLYKPLAEIHKLQSTYLTLVDKMSFYDAAEALGRALMFAGNPQNERLISPLVQESEEEEIIKKDVTQEDIILGKFEDFLKEITSDPEIVKTVAEENRDLIAKIQHLPILKDREVEADVRFEIFIKKLVSHTRENIKSVDGEKKLDGDCAATTIFFVKSFRSMIENQWGMTMEQRNVVGSATAEDENANYIVQALNLCGVTTLCIDLLNVGIDAELQTEALKLGIALLLRDGGAINIQQTMTNYLNKVNSELFFRQARLSIQSLIEWHNWQGAVQLKAGEEVDLPDSIYMIRYLQLMCLGHFKPNQELLREQSNVVSINILDDIVQYLNCLSRLQCRTSTKAASMVSGLLLEVLQGPCEKNQQHFALNTELVETLNRILRCKKVRDCIYEEELELKRYSIDIFQATLEGQVLNGVVYERVLSVIHLDVIQIQFDNDELTEQEKTVKTESFVLLQMLCNCKPSLRSELGIDEDVIDDSLKSGTACVEIIWRGEIQRRYFHVPPVCVNLSKSSKDDLVLGIDRTNNEKKLTEFLFRCRGLYKEVKHQQLLIDMNLSQVFSSTNYDRATTLAFLLALAINLLFLIYYSKDGAQRVYNSTAFTAINILNIFQIGTAFFTFLLFCVVRGPVKYQIYKEAGYSNFHTYLYTATDFMTLYYFGYFIVAILGMVHNDFWSSLLLLDVVMKNTTARDVLNAVYYPRKQLGMAFVLGVIILYVFSYVNFFYFEKDLHFWYKNNQPINDDHHFKQFCHSLMSCFATTSVYGLRQPMGTAALMYPTLLDRFALDMAYYVIVLVLAMNIIFGIVIDTFGNLRGQKNSRHAETIGKCFICNIDREVFDRAADGPDGFKVHVKRDHNMWNYMYFVFLIWEQNKESDDGLEHYIRDCIDKNELSWFPVRKAMRLNQISSEEDDLRNEMKDRVSGLEQKLKQRVNTFKLEFCTSIDQLAEVLRTEPDAQSRGNTPFAGRTANSHR